MDLNFARNKEKKGGAMCLSRRLLKLGFGAAVFLSATQVWAWGDLGHSTVGYIADYKLTKKGKNLVYQILGPEPLAISAVFPDHVRSDNRYNNFSLYHFLEIKLGKTFDDLKPSDRADKDSDVMISRVPPLLMDSQLTRDQKMILLRYLVHIVGDVHQPLHIGNGLDRGGNLCDVRWVHPVYERTEDDVLHSFWDDKIMMFIDKEFQQASGQKKRLWFGYREFGDMILKENQNHEMVNYEKVIKDAPSVWYTESQELHPVVYPDSKTVKPKDRLYCKTVDENGKVVNGVYDATKIPLLDETYVKAAIPAVKKRILMAGFRLAGILNHLAEEYNIEEQAKDADAKIFDPILLTNKSIKNHTAKKLKK